MFSVIGSSKARVQLRVYRIYEFTGAFKICVNKPEGSFNISRKVSSNNT